MPIKLLLVFGIMLIAALPCAAATDCAGAGSALVPRRGLLCMVDQLLAEEDMREQKAERQAQREARLAAYPEAELHIAVLGSLAVENPKRQQALEFMADNKACAAAVEELCLHRTDQGFGLFSAMASSFCNLEKLILVCVELDETLGAVLPDLPLRELRLQSCRHVELVVPQLPKTLENLFVHFDCREKGFELPAYLSQLKMLTLVSCPGIDLRTCLPTGLQSLHCYASKVIYPKCFPISLRRLTMSYDDFCACFPEGVPASCLEYLALDDCRDGSALPLVLPETLTEVSLTGKQLFTEIPPCVLALPHLKKLSVCHTGIPKGRLCFASKDPVIVNWMDLRPFWRR